MGKNWKDNDDDFEVQKKAMVEFEHITFNVRDFKRIDTEEAYDEHSHTRLKYGMLLYLSSYPFENAFWYTDEETRDNKKEVLEMILSENNIDFMEGS